MTAWADGAPTIHAGDCGDSPIQKTQLRAGDLLINPTPVLAGHVVIFDHWTDSSMTSYMGVPTPAYS
jgi:hypothetical protein